MLFKIMEENIIKVVEEKEEFEKEEKKIMAENMAIYNKLQKDYENNKIKYELYLKELEEEQKKIKNVGAESEMEDYYSYMNTLLEELCNYVNEINKEFIKSDIKNTLTKFNMIDNKTRDDAKVSYGRNLQKCINNLKIKEFMIEGLINEINDDIKEDAKLVKIITAQTRLENRIEKTENEKRKKQIEEHDKRQNIINKIGQYIYF